MDERRRLRPGGLDQAADGIGLQGLAIPGGWAGPGRPRSSSGVVFEEMGAALYCGPFLATVGLAATALLEMADEAASAATCRGSRHGTTIATLAWSGPRRRTARCGPNATRPGWTVTGTAERRRRRGHRRPGAGRGPHRAGSACSPSTAGRRAAPRHRSPRMDQTRKLAALTFDRAPAAPGRARKAARARPCAARFDLATLYLAAEQLGGAAGCCPTAVGYAKTRWQFGRPIGSFQAIKHRCADMLVELESARSVVYHGLWTAVHEPDGLPVCRRPGRRGRLGRLQGPRRAEHPASRRHRLHLGTLWRTCTSSAPRAASCCSVRRCATGPGWRGCLDVAGTRPAARRRRRRRGRPCAGHADTDDRSDGDRVVETAITRVPARPSGARPGRPGGRPDIPRGPVRRGAGRGALRARARRPRS